MRFRLLELFVVVGVIAFATVSLKRADPLFETLFFSFTLLAILVAFLLSIACRDAARAFWMAFAGTSSLYLALAHVPDSDELVPRHNGPEVTTQLLRVVYDWLRSGTFETNFSYEAGGFFSVQDQLVDSRGSDDSFGGDAVAEADAASRKSFPANLSIVFGSGQRVISSGDSISFMRIGHSAWALLLGWISGHFTRFIYERSRRQPSRPAP